MSSPPLPVFLKAEWRNLIIANYETDPELLKKYLPSRTELDTWQGRNYVSLVGFLFLNTRIRGFRVPYHINFEEINLRFYVRRKTEDGWRRGVVFIREFVPKPAIAWVANTFFSEKYRSLSMKSFIHGRAGLLVRYEWKWKNEWHQISFQTESEATEIAPGSEAEFITEHYWGYNRVSQSVTREYRVDHPRWKVYENGGFRSACNFATLYGDEWGFLNEVKPVSVFMAEGSEVSVTKGRTIQAE